MVSKKLTKRAVKHVSKRGDKEMNRWINAIAYVAMVGLNMFANIAKLGGNNTGEVSEQYANIFTPAPWTFAIWGAIYGLLLIFIIVPFAKRDGKTAALAKAIGGWFALSCAMNMVWILTWHYKNIVGSWIAMIALLVSLIVMFNKFSFESPAGENIYEKGLSWGSAGLSMYFAWICIATVANTMVLLVNFGVNGYGVLLKVLSVSILIAAAFILSAVSISAHNWLVAAGAIWAYAGIISKQMTSTETMGLNSIGVSAILGIILLLTGVIMSLPKGVFKNGNSIGNKA